MTWLEKLLSQHSELESPMNFWLWGGLAAISAVVKDNVWMDRQIYNLYPNIYVMYHAESGLKKGPPISMAKQLVKAVNGRVPVLMDSGIRRGDDILKALALGAKAVLIGRPYVWGLTAFGKEGLQRVIDILRGELVMAMGLAGVPNLAAIDSSLVRRAWDPPPGEAI